MKKLFTLFILTLSLLFNLTSCSDEAFDVDSVNKQTILVFLPWSGGANNSGITSALKANVDSICAGIVAKKGLNNTRVMVFFSEKYQQSVLYDLQYDETSKTVNRVPIKTYEGSTYNSIDGLADIINEVKQQAEALNYAMIIGCHGTGWTYAEDWENYPYLAKPHHSETFSSTWQEEAWQQSASATDNFSVLFGENSDVPKTRFFGSVYLKTAPDTGIDITTLAQALKKSNTKMQYILFDACYMGNVETAYELREVTNYLIASSSEIMTAGLPYKTLWSSINGTTPNYSSIVSGAINFYKNNEDPYCNLAAIDCRQMEKLANIMKEINSKYTLSSSVPLDSLQPLGGFSPHLFFDLGVYVDSLKPSGYLKDQFTSQLKATVKAAQSTDYVAAYVPDNRKKEIKMKSYSGLSISDPSQHNVASKGKTKTAWWQATH